MKASAEPVIMGIDVGTFGSKGVLCRTDGTVIAEHQMEHGLEVPRAGWAEQDADEVWWHDVCEISRRLLSLARSAPGSVKALAVSALGADLVPLGANGQALRPGILYGVDTRAIREIKELNERFGKEEIAKTSGHFLSAQSIGPKILWLRRNEPEVWQSARYLCSASTFLVYRLTGEYVLDYPTAAWFDPLFDIGSMGWDERKAEAIVGDKKLPQLRRVMEVVGQVTAAASRATGLAEGTPVTTGTLDAVAEAMSVGVNTPGDLMLMYGTTTFLIYVTDSLPKPDMVVWHAPYVKGGQYALEGGTATTGAVTRWFRDEFAKDELARQAAGGPEAYSILSDEAAAVPPGSGGLVMLPYFSGERTPLHDPDARGMIAGMNLTHRRGHIYRAILEATAYAVAHILEAFGRTGASPTRAVAVGGGTKNPLLLQTVSDVTGIRQDLMMQSIGAAYGDAFIAGVAAGLVSESELRITWARAKQSFQPDAEARKLYQGLYAIYRDLYTHTRAEMHALSRLQNSLADE